RDRRPAPRRAARGGRGRDRVDEPVGAEPLARALDLQEHAPEARVRRRGAPRDVRAASRRLVGDRRVRDRLRAAPGEALARLSQRDRWRSNQTSIRAHASFAEASWYEARTLQLKPCSASG